MNTKHVEDKTERKRLKRTARKKAAAGCASRRRRSARLEQEEGSEAR